MTVPSYPDAIELRPVDRPIEAVARLPGSKSITNCALLVAALAGGDGELTYLPKS